MPDRLFARNHPIFACFCLTAVVLLVLNHNCVADDDDIRRGSRTAKNGFRNEDDIRDKFLAWKTDREARLWLRTMGHTLKDIGNVDAAKPSGKKADIEVTVTSPSGERTERISIKLVSSTTGFNQIDKRWVKDYSEMWSMPATIQKALRYYVGELPPTKETRRANRMFLDELPDQQREAVIAFFKQRKSEIVSDLLAGDGPGAANWFLVTLKSENQPKWILKPMDDVVRFFADGDVVMTRYGNLKIGRISMQRKGGDNGRETAKMLQFKLNPAQLFEASSTAAMTTTQAAIGDGK